LTPEQTARLQERNKVWGEAARAWRAGEAKKAIAALEKVLAVNADVLGPWHGVTATTALDLANMHQAIADWPGEAKYRAMVLEAQRRLNGNGHWKAIDARLALAEALAQAKRAPAQRDALRRAQALNGQAMALMRAGQPAKAVKFLEDAPAARTRLGKKVWAPWRSTSKGRRWSSSPPTRRWAGSPSPRCRARSRAVT
jgi:hypothetical protein